MTGRLVIYVPFDLITYGGTFDAGNSHLLNVMRLLQRLGIVRFANMPVRYNRGATISYTITTWGRSLVWAKDSKRGYRVYLSLEDY